MSFIDMEPGGAAPAEPAIHRLTLREREVAGYITRGRSNKYIAAELGVSRRTIEAHRARIFMKTGVRNAVELTRHYVRLSLKIPASDDHQGPVATAWRAPAAVRWAAWRRGWASQCAAQSWAGLPDSSSMGSRSAWRVSRDSSRGTCPFRRVTRSTLDWLNSRLA